MADVEIEYGSADVEIEYGSIPDDHISVWFQIPPAVATLVRDLLPHVDFDRVQIVVVVPAALLPHWRRAIPYDAIWAESDPFTVMVELG